MSTSPRTRSRLGFTLVELIVVLVLLSIVGGGLLRVLSNQQRFATGTGDIIELRTQLRQGMAVVGNDLRNMSSVGGDIQTMTDSSIDFNYTVGSSIVCSKAGSSIIIPPLTLSSGTKLTSWISRPTSTDNVYVFDEGSDSTTSTDDQWRSYSITTVDDNVAGCGTPYTSVADNSSASYTVTLGSAPSGTIQAGAPVRFVRRVHYSLYRSSSDGQWYLGYCSLACSSTNAISPIAGPFNAYAAAGAGTSGLRFTYYDSTNTVTATAANVARINIVLRGTSRSYVNVQGMQRGYYVDSLRTDVAIRNRS